MTVSEKIKSLPETRGSLKAGASLARLSWFRTGGNADILFEPADEADLSAFLAGLDEDIPLTYLGVGSNLLVRDGGIRGVVIKLGKAFSLFLALLSRVVMAFCHGQNRSCANGLIEAERK